MPLAPDGSPVEVYRLLPPLGEPELVARVVPPGAAVLELGCGAGRLTHPLVECGYRVTAVDNSPEMLQHVRGAERVLADIDSLDLGRKFDCVLLASHFVNDTPERRRRSHLAACARHVADTGAVLIETYPPAFEWKPGKTTTIGDVRIALVAAERRGSTVRATMEYAAGDDVWRQPFEAELLDERQLAAALAEVRLQFDSWVDGDRGWLLARREP